MPETITCKRKNLLHAVLRLAARREMQVQVVHQYTKVSDEKVQKTSIDTAEPHAKSRPANKAVVRK